MHEQQEEDMYIWIKLKLHRLELTQNQLHRISNLLHSESIVLHYVFEAVVNFLYHHLNFVCLRTEDIRVLNIGYLPVFRTPSSDIQML